MSQSEVEAQTLVQKHVIHLSESEVRDNKDIRKPGWYFIDETEQINGPYDSESAAIEALIQYAKSI